MSRLKRGTTLLLTIIVGVILVGYLLWSLNTSHRQAKLSDKTFIVARGTDAIGLDPANVTDGESLYVTDQIFDSLLQYAPDSTEVQPALATNWDNSKDGLTWTFTLRPKVAFHDGTPFNAEAVKYNFDRWRLPKHPQHQGEFEFYRSMFGGFPGIIKDVQVVDDYTVRFILAKPQATFISNLAMSAFGLSSPTAIKKYGSAYAKHPVGTGPFVLTEWEKNQYIKVKRNPQYWGNISILKDVTFKVIKDNNLKVKMLQAGEIDAALDINPDDFRTVQQNRNLQVLFRPSMNVAYLAINNDKFPFDNPKVRQAISHAINKAGLIRNFYGSLAKVAKNPMPPSLWGYNDDIQDYPYDPAKAKALLAEAGLPEGFSTKLWTMPIARPYMPQPMPIALAIQQDLARIGIKAEVETFPWQEYIQKGEAGTHELYLSGWTGDNGDPDNFLFVLLDKSNTARGSASNLAFYKNDRVHDLLLTAREESDQKVRADLYYEAQALINQDAPLVPLVHTTPPVATKKQIRGWVLHPTGSEKFNSIEIVD